MLLHRQWGDFLFIRPIGLKHALCTRRIVFKVGFEDLDSKEDTELINFVGIQSWMSWI